MRKFVKRIIFGFLIVVLIFIGYFFIGSAPEAKEITWGVNFSQKQAELFGLDWQETYLALLDDLKVKNIKLITQWDLIEPRKGEYNFQDLDWQIKSAEEKGTKLILVIGMKTGRWPECHTPAWGREFLISLPAGGLPQGDNSKFLNEKLLEYIENIVNRYKNSKAIRAWQVENEPFFPFGECPKIEKKFLEKEINLVKSIDSDRPIIISDSGEFSFWITAAKLGDVVGTTLHRKVWTKELRVYITHYWFSPVYYWRKAQIIKKLFDKKVICVELQAEPWGPKLLYDLPLGEQEKSMNLEQFQKNIEFARKTGLDTFYLWGGEWWYWLKVKQNNPEIWNEVKKLTEIGAL